VGRKRITRDRSRKAPKKKKPPEVDQGPKSAPEPPLTPLGGVSGPPTLPLDEIMSMMEELKEAHQILDALDIPPGTITERLVFRARRWIAKSNPSSQTHPVIEAKKVIQAAGESVWQPGEGEAA
jgi:hypothetical protein